MNPILLAAKAAAVFHEGQTRKYDGSPYIVHPGRVAARISMHPRGTEAMVCAAWLHDVIEDCGASSEGIANALADSTLGLPGAQEVARLVTELTNPSKKFPDFCRADKKALDRKHFMSVSMEAKMIKLADRTDNLRDLAGAPDDFALMYFNESAMLFTAMTGCGTELRTHDCDIISWTSTVDQELEQEFADALDALKSRMPGSSATTSSMTATNR